MIYLNYRSKKELKTKVGHILHYTETWVHGREYPRNGTGTIIGSQPREQPMWFAKVTLKDHVIMKVE